MKRPQMPAISVAGGAGVSWSVDWQAAEEDI